MLQRLDFGKYKNVPVQIIPFDYLQILYYSNKRFQKKEYDLIRKFIEKTYPCSLRYSQFLHDF